MASIHDRLFAISSERRLPITGAFELTPVCNFQCRMCYVRKTPQEAQAAGGLQPLEFWLDIARQARDAGLLSPLLTGGETFLYPHIRELYTAMCRMGMEVSINSNGSCITEEVVAWLKENPPTRINITLYGASNETYGRMCSDPKGFDKVCRGVELLHKNKIRFKFNCSLMPQNAQDLLPMIEFARSYGQGLKVASYMFPPMRQSQEQACNLGRLSAEEAAYYQVLTDWHQLPPDKFRVLAANGIRYQELTPELIAQAAAGPQREMGCLSGRCSFWVDWQGNLSGCGMMDHPKASLKDKPFAQAWKEIVDWTNELRYSSVCANCVNRGICFSCAAMVYNECGNYTDRPVYLCEKAKYCAKFYQQFLDKLPAEASSAELSNMNPQLTCGFDENV